MADELRGDDLGGAREEGWGGRRCWESVVAMGVAL